MTQPYLTSDIAGTGGVIKQRVEDFLVDELPLYEPAGEGEHLYVCIQKRNLATMDVVAQLARVFGVRRHEVGYAGLKDKRALTRQHFSVRLPAQGGEMQLLERLQGPNLTVLWAQRHGNKLRRGHLAGNRFVIYIRQVEPAAVLRARQVLQVLSARGVPNFFGSQRFGYRGDNALMGRSLLLGEVKPLLDAMLGQPRADESPTVQQARAAYDRGDFASALKHWPRNLPHGRQVLDALRQGRTGPQLIAAIDPIQREFLVSAWQSAVFNRVLARRMQRGAMDRLIEGDLAWKHDNGSVFAVDGATAELENGPEGRVARLEVSPSGPIWGAQMTRASGQPGQWEWEALAEEGLSEEHLEHPLLRSGLRRPLRVRLGNMDVSAGSDDKGPYVRVAFDLPPGSYATTVLGEIIKPADQGTLAGAQE